MNVTQARPVTVKPRFKLLLCVSCCSTLFSHWPHDFSSYLSAQQGFLAGQDVGDVLSVRLKMEVREKQVRLEDSKDEIFSC